MNKLVYLFELDSVRNTPKEIEIGQAVMFEEIARNGNTVVLSFNQLTDSHAFMAAVENKETYPHILDLFRKGAIRISHFGNTRTPSQYIQNAIGKCNSTDGNAFIFSALPIKMSQTKLLKKIDKALRYSDPAILTEMVEKKRNELENDSINQGQKLAEIEKLEFIDRYIRMILMLSTDRLSGNKPLQGPHNDFSYNIDLIIPYYEKSKNKLLSEAAAVLSEIKSTLSETERKNRSTWVNKLYDYEKSDVVCMAEGIVDICYNFTVEESILNVSRHFDSADIQSFYNEFESRLDGYWEDYKNGIHIFHKCDNDEMVDYKIKLPHWITASRMYEAHKEEIIFKGELYEKNSREEKLKWKARVLNTFIKTTLVSFMYIIILVLIDIFMQEFEGVLFQTENLDLSGRILIAALSSVLFGVLGSLITLIFNLPDFLDAFRSIFHCVLDTIITKRSPKKSYNHSKKGKK